MVLHLENVCAKAHRTPLLHAITLQLEPGECLGLIGPNGSGKSTLMRLMAGLGKPASGEIRFGAVPLHRISARARAQKIAFVEQQAETTDRLRVREAVELGRIPFLSPLRGWTAQDDAHVAKALAALDMQGMEDRLWHSLSGGERQRVHIARALAQTPELLLLDEPTNHLDIRHQLALMGLVRALPVTRVIALHDLNQAFGCDRVALLEHGRLRAIGPPSEVLTLDHLRGCFGVEAQHIRDPDGRPLLHFIQAL
ncbi:ABC transporter ATP-binding protein (plasmid) [Thioclava litoralis]|uniref:ABC transporter ATP-binding protein n=1 Tax=Thioclava litoralis TaxID=3076557 RepID=A0ABZ1E2F1_9RHOB|nr:ABC transporter ATP-binding protein [Thioclava sp. FTW29]